jgi:hypothetical protein
MSKKIYKLFIGKTTEAWHRLSKDEQHELLTKVQAAVEQAGGKRVLMCDPTWSTEEWHFWGVEEFPDIEAVMKHTKLLAELTWERYVDSMTFLGTKY